jgi:hypothetical protein
MVEIYPEYSEAQLEALKDKSEAELKLYEAFRDQLSDEYMVLHHVTWITPKQFGAFDGEADFLVCHDELGILVVEVKGGGIRVSGRQWFTKNRKGEENPIKDPFDQARENHYAIRRNLNNSPGLNARVKNLISWGYSVVFPDIDQTKVTSLLQPHIHKEILGTGSNLKNIDEWLKAAFKFHYREGRGGVGNKIIRQIIKDTFVRDVKIEVGRIAMYAEINKKMIELTEEQFEKLTFIDEIRRAAISGGAGTGKTVLATEKAKRLGIQGHKTLLLCYNRLLADKLAVILAGVPNVTVSTVHSFFQSLVKSTGNNTGRDYILEAGGFSDDQKFFDVVLPTAAEAAIRDLQPDFDAVVVDEAQDFSELFWFPIQLMVDQEDEKPLYVFYDSAQDIFKREGIIPIKTPPLSLTRNCRNTVEIFNETYKNFVGPTTKDSKIHGPEVSTSAFANLAQACKFIGRRLVETLSALPEPSHDISILIGADIPIGKVHEMLSTVPLPKPFRVGLAGEKGTNIVFLETIARFKGLESNCVFLLFGNESSNLNQEVYVGGTRATHELHMVMINESKVINE